MIIHLHPRVDEHGGSVNVRVELPPGEPRHIASFYGVDVEEAVGYAYVFVANEFRHQEVVEHAVEDRR